MLYIEFFYDHLIGVTAPTPLPPQSSALDKLWIFIGCTFYKISGSIQFFSC